MKQLVIGLLSGFLLLSACGETSPTAQTTLDSDVVQTTSTPSPFPTATPTPSVTPLPTIPTFTPTFDVSTIVTVTPAPKAECPKETSVLTFNPELRISTDSPNKQFTDYTINFLNSGGAIKSIRARYEYPDEIIRQKDLTGDGISELIIAYGIWFDIFGCGEGNFQLLSAFTTDAAQGSKIIDIVDINLNGLPDLIGYYYGCFGFRCPSIEAYEWNGNEFKSLISVDSECWQKMPAPLEVEIKDLDQNGTKEIILSHNGKPWPDGFGYPYRGVRRICTWNGETIDALNSEYIQPVYRYQALQDGDSATRAGDFQKALTFYTRVISDNTLEWFTTERNNYDFWLYSSEYFPLSGEPTPTVSPSLKTDPAEYPRLAAYAYYRILLLHLVQGQESEATATYTTLVQTFGDDPYAHPYVEMASAFWEAYQSTHKMYDGCAAAIQYAVEHPEILTPLGSDYHGWQSHTYVPEDVCPFR
jgi:hypothetical protein